MPTGSKTDKQGTTQKAAGGKRRFVKLSHFSRQNFEFYLDILRGLRPFQYTLERKPEAEASVLTTQFFGLCLAVPSSASECAQILSFVGESSVGAIRFDFSYDQDYERASELLSGLRELEVNVLLHLVQPLRAASEMPGDRAMSEWKAFLETSCELFKGLFEAIEVGTTINRARWAGYDLEGFIATWEIAYEFCQRQKITLVGPNVTDFEPQYNAGTLGALARRRILPDIHSNNLFAERSIEPEDADHKMLSYAFRHLHGYNLIRKI